MENINIISLYGLQNIPINVYFNVHKHHNKITLLFVNVTKVRKIDLVSTFNVHAMYTYEAL